MEFSDFDKHEPGMYYIDIHQRYRTVGIYNGARAIGTFEDNVELLLLIWRLKIVTRGESLSEGIWYKLNFVDYQHTSMRRRSKWND